MEDIRLPTAELELDGKIYKLRCNNNVLADVQQAFGSMREALATGHSLWTAQHFLAAMLNDCADENGWSERFTPRDVGRRIPPARMREIERTVMSLVAAAFEDAETGSESPQDAPEGAEASQPCGDGEKNA